MSTNDIELAKLLADKYHAGQKYGELPYTKHLQDVVESVSRGVTDKRAIVVAWLHDSREDTDIREEMLSALFEDNIVDAISAITHIAGETRDEYMRKVKANPLARMVKLHDSFCNLRESLERYDAKRIKKYSAQINFLVSE